MPKWKPSSPALLTRFSAALPRDSRIEPKKMFGFPAAFLSRGFFVGLHEERVVVRLPDDVLSQMKVLAGAEPFDPMDGRPLKGWYVVPSAIAGSERKLGALLGRLLDKLADHPEQPSSTRRKAPAKKAAAAPPVKRAPPKSR